MDTNVKTVLLTKNKISTIDINKNLDIDNLDIISFKSLIKKGKGKIVRYCDWEHDNDITISVFGWKEGEHGTENKNDLPPPEDNDIYFGDILIIKTHKKELCPFSKKDYEIFYEKAYGGFETLGSEDSIDDDDDSDNEYDLSDSFIATSDDECDLAEEDDEELAEFTDSSESEKDPDDKSELKEDII